MKGVDRPLTAIILGVLLLVVLAFAVAFTRAEPGYRPDDTPEGVAHNYLLALQREEYERAYDYLSPELANYPPTVEAFIDDVLENRWLFDLAEQRTVSLTVESARFVGERAVVTVREEVFSQGDLFGGGHYESTFSLYVRREGAAWKIVNAERYWWPCWDEAEAKECP